MNSLLMSNIGLSPNFAAQASTQGNAGASDQAAQRNTLPAGQQDVQTQGEETAAPRGRREAPDTTESQFSKLIASKPVSPKQESGNAPQRDDAEPVTVKSSENTNDDASDDLSNEPAIAPILSLFIQLQAVATSAQGEVQASDAATAPDASSQSDNDAMQELLTTLRTLLEQALQPAQTQNAQNNAPSTDASSEEETAAPSSAELPEETPANINALIQALLQQLQGNNDAPEAATTPATDDLAAIDAGKPATTPLADALTKLAALLEQVAPEAVTQATSIAPVQTATEEAASPVALPVEAAVTVSQKSEETDTTKKETSALPATEETADTDTDNSIAPLPKQAQRSEFQQAVSSAVDELAKHVSSKQDTSTDASATATLTPAVTHAQPQQAPVQEASFVKHLEQPTPQLPVQDQVLVQIKHAVNDGTSQIRIQLHPEDLGKVDVQLSTGSDGKTGITITADNRHTLAMLQNEARALQDALRDIGLKTDSGSLNFNLRDSGQDARNSSKQQQGSYTHVAGIASVEGTEDALSAAGVLYRIPAQQGLDIRV